MSPDSIACGSTGQVERNLNMMCCTGQAVLNRANAQIHMDELFLLGTPGVIGLKVPCALGMLLMIGQQKHVPPAGIEILLVLNGLGIVCWLWAIGRPGFAGYGHHCCPLSESGLVFCLSWCAEHWHPGASFISFHFISFHFGN